MYSLLDEVFANTANGPVILSEQHDTSAIDWRAGVSDVAEMVKLSARAGETQEQAKQRTVNSK